PATNRRSTRPWAMRRPRRCSAFARSRWCGYVCTASSMIDSMPPGLWIRRMPTRPERRHRLTAGNRGIECLLLAWLASGELQPWRFRINAIAAVAAILVWLASYDNDYLLPEGYFKRVLVWVGARSYAICLIHIPVYFLLRELGFRLGTLAP